jgi:hypothetical protein
MRTIALVGATLLIGTAPLVTAREGRMVGPRISETIQVAPPVGDPETDRINVQTAFDAAQPGSTVQFAPGTYLLGAGVALTVPDVTVLGHPDGTVLRGCDPEAFEVEERDLPQLVFGCTGIYVQAERQAIRGLTFEYTWHGIVVGAFPTSAEEAAAIRAGEQAFPPAYPAGGHRIEGNTFRFTPNGLRVLGTGTERSVVRDNDFVDVYHAIGIYGAPLHFLDNRVTVRNPTRVPFSRHPGSAVLIAPQQSDCAGHVVAGNLIEGYPDPIYVIVDSGETCRGAEIVDNTIRAARVGVPEGWATGEDATIVGVPINLVRRVGSPAGQPAAETGGSLEGFLIRGNRILGAEGLGIRVENASRLRIEDDTIAGIRLRTPFPGATWDGAPSLWGAANGSAIWVSPGSELNEIVGNTFEDVAGATVFVEGDGNIVALRSADDTVRDLGNGNRVTLQDGSSERH